MVFSCISAGSSEYTFVYLSGASPEYSLSPIDNICLSSGSDLDQVTYFRIRNYKHLIALIKSIQLSNLSYEKAQHKV